MKKFLQYLTLRDFNDEFLFPSPIGHIVFVILFVIFVGTCSHKRQNEEPKVNHIIMEDAVQVGDSIEAPWAEKTDSTEVEFSVPKGTYWSSEETKLPRGIVKVTDHAHGSNGKSDNKSDNYVTIKGTDGQLTIVRDVEIDLYLNLQVGDTIK